MSKRKWLVTGVVAALVVIGAGVLAGRKHQQRRSPTGAVSDAASQGQQELQPVPSGEGLAFVRWGDIWVMRLDGSHLTRMTFFGGERSNLINVVHWFCWSPDGTKVAFLRGGGDVLWVMEADGSSPSQEGPSVDRQRGYFTGTRDPVVWTLDSKRLVFAVRDESGDGEVWTVAAEGEGARKLADIRRALSQALSRPTLASTFT